MFILKNAYTSIIRNKGRNILIGIIIIVIACASAVSLAIRSSAKSLIDSYANSTDVVASIGINRENMMKDFNKDEDGDTSGNSEEDKDSKIEDMKEKFSTASSISVSDIESYGDSDYVKSYYYSISIGMNGDGITKASSTSSNDDSKGGDMPGGHGKENFNAEASSGDFTLVGYSSLDAMEDFINGSYTIKEGEVSSDLESNSCVINSELASLNNLSVGDEITLIDSNNTDNKITLKITGIFEENSESDNAMGMFSSSVNSIITNVSMVNKVIEGDSDISKTVTPSFILTSKNVVDKFESELYDKGMNENLAVTTNLDEVSNATSTISNVKSFATVFLVITLIIGGIVLFVINMINIRERKYEIGVLRTIGMTKKLLTFQFISETLMVAVVSLTVGAAIGACISVPVSNSLLASEINSSSNKVENINKNFGGDAGNKMQHVNGVASVQAFDSIDAVVDLKVLLELFGIGIGLILVSSSASMISIQRFSPLTILKERS